MIIKVLKISVVILSFVLLLCPSCGPPPPMDMNPRQNAMVDTLYTRSTKLLRPKLDSLCEVHFEERVALAVDSILEMRLREREALLKR